MIPNSIKSFLFLLLLFSFVPLKHAQALRVDSIRFGTHPDKIRMVLELDETVDYRVFLLQNPYRIVVDLPRFDLKKGRVSKAGAGNVVKRIRTGHLQADIDRLVVDVDGPVVIQRAFFLPRTSDSPNRLVIDFNQASRSEFLNQKGKIHGKLTTDYPELNLTPLSHSSPSSGKGKTGTKTGGNNTKPSPAGTSATSPGTKNTKKPLIIIDAGHGGKDPGAIGINKTYEKTITLSAARELKKQLDATGRYKTYLTRNSDKFIKLHNRVKIARKHKGDLFISLHADAVGDKSVRGMSIYTLSNKSSDAQTAKLAARENRSDLIDGIDLSHEDKDVSDILIDLTMRHTVNQSKILANTLVKTVKAKRIRMLPSPHRYAGFAVLKAPDIPSILIEMGFMSNISEVRALSRQEYRKKLMSSIVDGIDRYFEQNSMD